MTDATTTSSPLPDPDARARRNVWVLMIAHAFLGAQIPINIILGGLSGQVLSPDKCLATLPISALVIGSMLSTQPMSSLMQRRGRRTGFVVGAAAGALGGVLSAAGIYFGSFLLFLTGALATGVYMSAQGYYRFAATATASEAFRPKAISYVLAGGLLAALIGPQLVKVSEAWTGPYLFAGGYLAAVGLNVIGVIVFYFLDIPKPPAARVGPAAGRDRMALLRDPKIIVAMICAMVTYALMNLVMTSTPLAVVGCGFTTGHAADIVSAHVVAMFAPSFFTGHLIARFGEKRIIAAGLVCLAGAGVTALAGVALLNFYGALILLGLGWNFGFIGATTMLAGAHSAAERGRVQGMNDFGVFGLMTVASLSSGFLMNCSGSDAEAGWAAVNIAMLPFLTFAGAALAWFALWGERRVA